MAGPIISLFVSANPLFVCDKWQWETVVCRSGSPYKKYHFTPQLAVNNACV